MLAAENRVPDVQRSVLYEDARGRPEADFHLRFENRSRGAPFRIGFEFQNFRLKGMIVTAKNFAHFDDTTNYKAIVETDSTDPAALLRSFGLEER